MTRPRKSPEAHQAEMFRAFDLAETRFDQEMKQLASDHALYRTRLGRAVSNMKGVSA